MPAMQVHSASDSSWGGAMHGGRTPLTVPLVALATWMLATGCEDPAERPVEWSYLYTAVVRPACTTSSCHSKVSSAGGLDLSTASAAYSYLLGRPCSAPDHPQDAIGNYVFPYQPERSRLLALLRGDRTSVMPPDLPLPATEIALVERWILEGAPCD